MTDSSTGRAARRLLALWRRAVATSLIVRRLRGFGRRVDDALERSALARAFRTIRRWVRGSWLYRWLTAEPDPEVIVIDLRETYTVGPIIAVLDWMLSVLEGWWETALIRDGLHRTGESLRRAPIRVLSLTLAVAIVTDGVLTLSFGSLSGAGIAVRGFLLGGAILGTRVTTPWTSLRQSRTIRFLVAALEPPEPPEERDEPSQKPARTDNGTDTPPEDSEDAFSSSR